MTIAAIDDRAGQTQLAWLRTFPLWLWWLVALLVAAGLAVLVKGGRGAFEFIDSDDALRLIHVRELLAGAPWFEVTTRALGGEAGLVSHWSRLIDAPLAVMLAFFRLWLPEIAAQNAVVAIWPTLMLGAVLWAIGRATEEVHGRGTALFALALAALSVLAYYQFAPGRIDHHNVMIATTVSAALMIWAWPQSIRAWRWAGVLCAIALAIGYEAMAPVFAIAGLVAVWGLFDQSRARHAAAFVLGLVATLALVAVATIPPSRWLAISCDALSLNIVVLAGLAGAGYALVTLRGAQWSWPRRISVLAATGSAGVACFGALEPACLAGPMGQVPAELGQAWMGQVDEAQSILMDLLRGKPKASIGPVVVFAVGLAMAMLVWARSSRAADRFLLIATLVFVALALWQVKYVAYASIILVPAVAISIAGLPDLGTFRAPFVRGLALLIANQIVLFSLALALQKAAMPAAATSAPAQSASAASPQLACTGSEALRAFAGLPPGLFVTHNDIGAHLAAATPHRALSGPYHRIPKAIMANNEILAATSMDAAGRALAREKADYVLLCAAMDTAQLERSGWSNSFLAELAEGRAPAWLIPVETASDSTYRLWRVDQTRIPRG